MPLSVKAEVDKLFAGKETFYGPPAKRVRPYDAGYRRGYTVGVLHAVAALLVGGALVGWLLTRGIAG